jgi:hypothetical protein
MAKGTQAEPVKKILLHVRWEVTRGIGGQFEVER